MEISCVDSKNKINLSGTVSTVSSTGIIMVKLDNKLSVMCHLAKRIRKFNSSITPGDTVDVEISPYDLTKGKIVHRHVK